MIVKNIIRDSCFVYCQSFLFAYYSAYFGLGQISYASIIEAISYLLYVTAFYLVGLWAGEKKYQHIAYVFIGLNCIGVADYLMVKDIVHTMESIGITALFAMLASGLLWLKDKFWESKS